MTSTSRDRLSRVRSFDHGTFGGWPEYVAAQKALDALAHVLVDHGQNRAPQDWLELVADMASVLPFSDCCDGEHAADDPQSIAAPWKVVRQGDWLRCHYYCPTHRRTWSCDYSTTLVEYL